MTTKFCQSKNREDLIPTSKTLFKSRSHQNERYTTVYTFNYTDSITALTKIDYKAAISFDSTASPIRPINDTLDTGAKPNLLSEYPVDSDHLHSERRCNWQRLNITTNQIIEVCKTIVLHVQSRESSICGMFRIFTNLAVSIVISTSSIDKCMKGISPTKI